MTHARFDTVAATLLLVVASTVVTLFAPPGVANAQGRPLLVVPFEREQVTDEDYNRFMEQIRSDADTSGEYMVLPVVDQTLNDLLFAVGCAEPDPECLQLIGESFQAEVILYGSIWRNDRTMLQTVNMFDVQAGTTALEVPIEETYETDDPDELFDLMVSCIQQIFFPYTGEITVNTVEPGADVVFDGEPVGNTENGPLNLTGRPLGQHIITARMGDLEVSKSVVLVHGKTASVEIDLQDAVEHTGGGYGHLFSYVAFGVGGASLVGGAIFSFLTSSADDRAGELGDMGSNPAMTKSETDEADNLRNNGPTYELLQWIFYGVGSAAIVTGAVLFYYEGPSASSESSASRTIITPFVTSDGVGAGAIITF